MLDASRNALHCEPDKLEQGKTSDEYIGLVLVPDGLLVHFEVGNMSVLDQPEELVGFNRHGFEIGKLNPKATYKIGLACPLNNLCVRTRQSVALISQAIRKKSRTGADLKHH